MLSFSGSLKIFVAVEPCDMRMGFNGLQGGDDGAKKSPPPWRLNWKNRSPLTAAPKSADRVNRACRNIFQQWRPSWILTRSKPILPPGGAWAQRSPSSWTMSLQGFCAAA